MPSSEASSWIQPWEYWKNLQKLQSQTFLKEALQEFRFWAILTNGNMAIFFNDHLAGYAPMEANTD